MNEIQVRKRFNWLLFIVLAVVAAVLGYGAAYGYRINFWVVSVACWAALSLYHRKNIFFEERKMSDPLFGELLFMGAAKGNQSYWEGRDFFEPTQREIEYSIDADEDGPGEAQWTFYRKFVHSYPVLKSAVMPLLHRRFLESTNGNQWVEPEFVAVSIPLSNAPDCTWEMSFEHTEPMGNPHYTVHMRGWMPTGEVDNE